MALYTEIRSAVFISLALSCGCARTHS